jgi:simple sugar transport system ATP-binding protein
MAEPLLAIRGLTKSFGGLRATDGVDLDVREGETRAIIGPNGAGKTTLIGQLAGDLRPDAGAISFAGRDVTRPAARSGERNVADHLIELRDITKSYGSVYALGGVSLSVDEGEVVGLIGDNGAGKSTLIKILAGVVRPTSGEIRVRSRPVAGWNAARSREAGIETVFQDRALAVQQSIVRNVFMGRELAGRFGFLSIGREIREAARLMREIGFTSKVFTPYSIVGQLSGGERQGVAIARAIYKEADLIILDEPTTALSLTETAKVFHFVRQVRASGRSILFIGHNIHHVFDIAERFVVLDRGKVALETDRSEIKSVEQLINFMEEVAHPGSAPGVQPKRISAGVGT